MSESNSYKQIIKSTGLFGGVQVINMLISIVRVKITAIYLGPAGVGIMSLLMATSNSVKSLTNLGIATSGVQKLTEAQSKEGDLPYSLLIVFSWSIISGLLGLGVMLLFSNQLSVFTFGDLKYVSHFRLLSITIFMASMSTYYLVALQSLRMLRQLALSNLVVAILSFFSAIPLFVLWGENGILPVLLIGGTIMLLLPWAFYRKLKIKLNYGKFFSAIKSGKGMIRFGLVLAVSGMLGALAQYLVNAFINKQSSTEVVGFYQASLSLTTVYLSMVFNAMGTDFFPRLSKIQSDKAASFRLISEQTDISVLVIAPLVGIVIPTLPLIVKILYTPEFLVIVPVVVLGLLAAFFRAVNFAMGYLILAKGDYKLSFVTNNLSNLLFVLLSVIFFKLYGFIGIGISTLVLQIINSIVTFLVVNIRYGFVFPRVSVVLICYLFLLLLVIVVSNFLINNSLFFYISLIFVIILCVFAYRELDKRIGVGEMIISLKSRFFRS